MRQLRGGLARRVVQADPVQHVMRVDVQAPGAVARQGQRRAHRLGFEQSLLLIGEARRPERRRCEQRQAGGDCREEARQIHERTLPEMRCA